MRLTICPRCGNNNSLFLIADGVYQCKSCGYTGDTSGKGLLKS
ncbi:hypothetical protein C0585_02805 [Candidatus Woesearchaeota archaeon]|nr:MAG: hypothetical protein C0585_02805 [Candidatus Woesearchaeota archaeon]